MQNAPMESCSFCLRCCVFCKQKTMAALPHFPQAIVLHFAYILLCKMFSKMLTPMGAFCVAFHFETFYEQKSIFVRKMYVGLFRKIYKIESKNLKSFFFKMIPKCFLGSGSASEGKLWLCFLLAFHFVPALPKYEQKYI